MTERASLMALLGLIVDTSWNSRSKTVDAVREQTVKMDFSCIFLTFPSLIVAVKNNSIGTVRRTHNDWFCGRPADKHDNDQR